MATVFSLPTARPATAIFCDLAAVNAALKPLYALSDLEDREDAELARLDDRRERLEAEAQAAIYAATGVSWELWQGALS